MSVTLKIPYLTTVWATGSFTQDHSNPDWIIAGRKNTRVPAPFYRKTVGEFEIDTIDTSYAEFDLVTSSNRKCFCMDSEGNFFLRDSGNLDRKYRGRADLSTVEAIGLLERNNILEDKQVMISESLECTLPRDIFHHISKIVSYKQKFLAPERHTGFLASADDLSANVVIIDECDNTYQEIQSMLNEYVYHNGHFYQKVTEPVLLDTQELGGKDRKTQIICDSHKEKEVFDSLFPFIRRQISSVAPGSLYKTQIQSIENTVEVSNYRYLMNVQSVWQINREGLFENIKDDAGLLNMNDNRDLCKMILKLFSRSNGDPCQTRDESIFKEIINNPCVQGNAQGSRLHR